MSLIDKCIAQLSACFCRIGKHIFGIWNVTDEGQKSIIFKLFRQIIYILKMQIEGLLADIGLFCEFLHCDLLHRFGGTQFDKCAE